MNLLSKQIRVLLGLTFSALSCLNALVDFDNDGFSDLWEDYYGLYEYDSDYSNWDEDGDGFSSIAEMWAGTDPKDGCQAETPGFYASSVPAYYSKDNIFNLKWTERPGVKYRIYCLNDGQSSYEKYFTGGEALSEGLSRSQDQYGNSVITYRVSGYTGFIFEIQTWWDSTLEVDDDSDGLSNLEEYYFGSSPYETNSYNENLTDYEIYIKPDAPIELEDSDSTGLSYLNFDSLTLSEWNYTWLDWILPADTFDPISSTGWVYSPYHGWLFVTEYSSSNETLRFIDPDLGSVYTEESYYGVYHEVLGIWFHLEDIGCWVFYLSRSRYPRWFWPLSDFSSGWVSVYPGFGIDTDSDGLSDTLELLLNGDLSVDANQDSDLDGVHDYIELIGGFQVGGFTGTENGSGFSENEYLKTKVSAEADSIIIVIPESGVFQTQLKDFRLESL